MFTLLLLRIMAVPVDGVETCSVQGWGYTSSKGAVRRRFLHDR